VIAGGTLVALTNFADWIVKAIQTHNFASGHDFTNQAVEGVLLNGTANYALAYLGLLAGLTLCVGMFMVMLAAMRVGLIARWLAYVGMFSALMFILSTGAAELAVIPPSGWPRRDSSSWAASREATRPHGRRGSQAMAVFDRNAR